MRSFSYTLRPSTAAVSAAFGVDALKQLAAEPTPRRERPGPLRHTRRLTDSGLRVEFGANSHVYPRSATALCSTSVLRLTKHYINPAPNQALHLIVAACSLGR